MKVIEQTDNRLILRPRGGILMAALGLVFAVLSVVMFSVFGQTADLTCERRATGSVECRLARTLLGLSLSEEPLEALQGATLSQSEDSEGDVTYKIILNTGGGDVAFTPYTSSGYRKKAAMVKEVNAFVQGRGPILTVRQGGTAGLIASVAFFALSIFLMVSGVQSRFTRWTFDLAEGIVSQHKETLTGLRSRTYPMDEIQYANVQGHHDSDGDRTYRVELFSESRGPIPLMGWYSSGYRKKREAADLIQHYLDRYHGLSEDAMDIAFQSTGPAEFNLR